MPQHRHAFIVSAVLLCLAQAATAEVSDQDAIAAQLGSALGSADFASKLCPNIAIDTSRIDELAKRAKQTPEQLRKGENYAEQRDVVDAMAKQHGNAMVCMLLPKAHGGFARGVLQAR
mgnify:CR=1 FL=1